MEQVTKETSFNEMAVDEMQEVDGGIAPALVYGGALLGSWAVGHIIGYVFG